MPGNNRLSCKMHAQVPEYVSHNQLKLAGFVSNRPEVESNKYWVVLAHFIPWNEIVCISNSYPKDKPVVRR